MLPFLTAFDSISTSSGSIDPLVALKSYVALADLLLPGVKTITNRSRYLSMLCAALKNIENHRRFPPGPIGMPISLRLEFRLHSWFATAAKLQFE